MAPEVDSDDENVEYEDESGHRYRLYLDELEGGSNPGATCKDTSGEVKVLQGKNFYKLLIKIQKPQMFFSNTFKKMFLLI